MNRNSLFYKLHQIQRLAKDESSQKNIIIKVKDSHLKDVQEISLKILEQKLKISSIVDNLGSEEEVKYVLKTEGRNFPFHNSKVYTEKLLFRLRDDQEQVFQLLTHCETDVEKKAIASFFMNFFYNNSFSSEPIENELLLMIYRTIDNEIASSNINQPESFLNNSINAYFFKHFIHREDVINYFTCILAPVIDKIDKQEEGKILTLDPNVLSTLISEVMDVKKDENKKIFIREIQQANDSDNSKDNESMQTIEKAEIILGMTKDTFFNLYIPDMTVDVVKSLTSKMNDKETIMHVLNSFQIDDNNSEKKTNEIMFEQFGNSVFINNVYKSQYSTEILETFYLNFAVIVDLIKLIFTNLNNHIDIIPNSVRLVCKLIAMTTKEMFPNAAPVQRNAFVARFFFDCLLCPIFSKPELCGLVKSAFLLGNSRSNMELINKLLSKFVSASYFNTTQDPNYTLLNRYFIENIQIPQDFISKLIDIELPLFLRNITTKKNSLSTYKFDYFKENPNEHIRDISIGVCYEHMDIITDIFEKHKLLDKNNKLLCKSHEMVYKFIQNMKKEKPSKTKDKKEDKKNKNANTKQQDDGKVVYFYRIDKMLYSSAINTIINFNHNEYCLSPKAKESSNGEQTKESDEEKAKKSNIIKAKTSLVKILLNLQNIDTYPVFVEKIQTTASFHELLVYLCGLNYLTLDASVENEWYLKSYFSLLSSLPLEYKVNDYNLFYKEIISDLEQSLSTINYINLSYVVNKTRYARKNLDNYNKSVERLVKFGIEERIRNYMEQKDLECYLTIPNKNKQPALREKYKDIGGNNIIIIKPKDNMLGTKLKYLDDFLFEENKTVEIYCANITELTSCFPSFEKIAVEKMFSFEEKYIVPQALDSYYDIILQRIYNMEKKKKNMLERRKTKKNILADIEEIKREIESDENYKEMKAQLRRYVMNKIFAKLFPSESLVGDREIYSQCRKLSWINWEHLIEYDDLNKENLTALAINALKKLNEIKCPNSKLKFIKELYEIAYQNLRLYKEQFNKTDMYRYLIYFVIKTQPTRLMSNFQYIKLYADFSIENITSHEFEEDFNVISTYIQDLGKLREMLFGEITEDKFNQLCVDKENELNLSKSGELSGHNLSISMKKEDSTNTSVTNTSQTK